MSPVTTIFDPKPESGEEHLHLLAGGVLRLVENDERIVEGVMCEQEILGDVKGIRGSDLDADRLFGACRLDAFNEPHWSATAGNVVLRDLACQPERNDPLGKPNIEDVRIGSMMNWASPCEPRFASLCFPFAAIHHSAQRLDEERYIVGELFRGRSVLDPTRPAVLCHRPAIGVEQPL